MLWRKKNDIVLYLFINQSIYLFLHSFYRLLILYNQHTRHVQLLRQLIFVSFIFHS